MPPDDGVRSEGVLEHGRTSVSVRAIAEHLNPLEVAVPPGLKVSGVVLSDQVKSVDWKARGASLLCSLPDAVVRDVLNKVGTLLDA